MKAFQKSLGVATAVLLVAAGAALADTGSISDPDDGGSQRVWDIERISHSHVDVRGTELIQHEIDFYDDVSGTDFSTGFGPSGVTVLIDLDPDRDGPERLIRFIKNVDGSLSAPISTKGGRVIGFARFYQPAPDRLTFEFPRSVVRGVIHYRWLVNATSRGGCEPQQPGGTLDESCADLTDALRH